MIRPLGVSVEERTTRELQRAGTASKGTALTGRALVLPALLSRFWRWFVGATDPIATYHRTHPARAPLALTHPQRRRAYKRAAAALERVRRDGEGR